MFLCSCLLSYKSEMCFFSFSVHPFSYAYHLGPTQYEDGTSNGCLLGLYRLFRQHPVEQFLIIHLLFSFCCCFFLSKFFITLVISSLIQRQKWFHWLHCFQFENRHFSTKSHLIVFPIYG